MTNDEILQAAKEAGCNVIEVETWWITYRDEPVGNMLERFASIIEKRTIERCASLISYEEYDGTKRYCFDEPKDCVAAIRKLGEQE